MSEAAGAAATPAGIRRSPAWQLVLLGALPAAYAAAAIHALVGPEASGFHRLRDLHVFWLAGSAYLHGHAVYPSLATVSHPPTALAGNLFVYPAPAAAAFVPLSLLPYNLACVVFAAAGLGALAGSLWLLGVRDWRCYGLFALWPMTMPAVTVGTLSPFLLLAVAGLWRARDRRGTSAVLAAVALTAKLFLWPLVIWLASSRRRPSAFAGLLVAAGAALVAWIPVGGLDRYPSLLHALSLSEGPSSFQPVWLLPGSPDLRLALLEIVAVAGAVGLAVVTRRRGELAGFSYAIGLALLASPIVWQHYLVLLAVPVALRSPTLSRAWLVPLALWAWPFQTISGQRWAVLLAAAVVAAVVAFGATGSFRPGRSATA